MTGNSKTETWLERQILLFPLVVILLSCASFLLGGHCAPWQWWGSVATMLALPFVARADRRVALSAGGLFLLTLGALFVCVRLSHDSYWVDAVAYHLPATRLLIDGWNPFTAATPDALGAAMQVDPEGMRLLHVLFLQKAVWVFNAVSFSFHGDAQSVTTPMEFYAFFMAAVALWRTLDTWRRPFRLLLVCALWTFCAGLSSEVLWIPSMTVVDDVCAMMIFSLMVAMARDLARRTVSWERLVPLTLLAVVAKSAGALACFVLWAFFAVVALVRARKSFGRTFLRFAAAGAGMAVYFAVVCASPYFTAWRDYDHPLYPMARAEADQPVYDFVSDLNLANQDFHEMGPVGYFVNAYVSPSLAQGYYRRKLHQEDYYPTCIYWQCMSLFAKEGDGIVATTLTTFPQRLAILAALAILLFLPGWRIVTAMALLALAASPGPLYGYLRYFKWVLVLPPFAVLALAASVWTKLEPRLGKVRLLRALPAVFAVVLGGAFACGAAQRAVQYLGEKRQVREFDAKRVYSSVMSQLHWDCNMKFFEVYSACTNPRHKVALPDPQAPVVWQEDGSRAGMNAFTLLAKRLPALQDVEVVPLTPELRAEIGSTLRYDPLLAVYVPVDAQAAEGESAP